MYHHAPEDYVCPFCHVAEKLENRLTKRADIIYHDGIITAFIGSHQWPNNPGNVIIIPNAHHENIYTLPLRYATAIHDLAQAVALAMKTAYHCDGVSTQQHNEPAGNQDVWHYHLHVFPRYEGDNLYSTAREPADPADRARHAHLLREQLADWRPTTQ
jgi:histidine triad (HIT) family protein